MDFGSPQTGGLQNVIGFCTDIARRYPGVYWLLELGRDWLEAVQTVLGLRILRDGSVLRGVK